MKRISVNRRNFLKVASLGSLAAAGAAGCIPPKLLPRVKRVKAGMKLNKPMLFIPGPTDPYDEVSKRCGMVFPSYGGDWPAFHNQLVEKMRWGVFGLKDGNVILHAGSGTNGINSALVSLCTPEDDVLDIANPAWCARGHLKSMGIPFTPVDFERGMPIDPDRIRDEMKRKRHQFIYMCHNETSCGVLNPLQPIGEIAREFDAMVITDSVSGAGGVVVDMDKAGIDVATTATQKCLGMPPGLAPVAVSSRAVEYMEKMKNRRVIHILDLMLWINSYRRSLEGPRPPQPTPHTAVTNMIYALDWVVDRIIEEGIENVEKRNRAAGKRLEEAFCELGFKQLVSPEIKSPVVTWFVSPDGIDTQEYRDYTYTKHNTMVGSGHRGIRVAHFARASEPKRIEHLIKITKKFMKEKRAVSV